MRIDKIEIYQVAMPLIYPFRTAFGDDAVVESVLVKMSSGGLCGWGEASPWSAPNYSEEWASGAFQVLKRLLAPVVMSQEVSNGDELVSALAPIKGNRFAKAALDLAWWDLEARLQERPLWQLLGGTSDTITVGADFGVMEDLDGLLKVVEEGLAQGFRRTKLKFRPKWELEMVQTVRRHFPDLVMHIDCNSAYTLDNTDLFIQLDQYDLAMIEQPLAHDDLLDHAHLQAAISTPICLDESITSVEKARKAIQANACRWINIKPGRVGGLTNAVRIHDLCQDEGIPCWVGGMLESGIGASHCLALATLPNIRYPSDVFPTSRFYREDLADQPMVLSGPSTMQAHSGPGIGTAPVESRLNECALDYACLRV